MRVNANILRCFHFKKKYEILKYYITKPNQPNELSVFENQHVIVGCLGYPRQPTTKPVGFFLSPVLFMGTLDPEEKVVISNDTSCILS